MKEKSLTKWLLFAAFSLLSFYPKAQIFVDVNTGQDAPGRGTTWETAYKSILYAIWAPNYGDIPGEVIYVKEGTYTETPNSYETSDGINFSSGLANGNLPKDKNIILQGGFSSLLTGTDVSCGYNPVPGTTNSNMAVITEHNSLSEQGLFRVKSFNGNLTIKGFYIRDIHASNEQNAAVLTISGDCKNKTFTIEDSYIDNCKSGTLNSALMVYGSGTEGNTLNFKNSVFQNNAQGFMRQGNTGVNTINVENCEFKNNKTSVNFGGTCFAIKNDNASQQVINIKNSSFCENVRNNVDTYDGGAINLYGTGAFLLTIDNSTFYGNLAGGYGGAIYAAHTDLVLTNSKFGKNKSLLSGGAIYLYNGTLKASGNIFTENNASGEAGNADGGSYNISGIKPGAAYPAFEIKNETHILNHAQHLGGAFWIGNVGNQVVFDNCKFGQNDADYGGGIYSNTDMIVKNSYFDENKADNSNGYGKGGGIYSYHAGLYIQNNCFYKNYAVDGGSGAFAEDNGTPTRLFNIPFGYNTSLGFGVTQLRHIAEGNTFYQNTTAWPGSIINDDGVEGGALNYKDVKDNATGNAQGGNLALINNKFYNNIVYYTDGTRPYKNVAAGLTLSGLSSSNNDNIVLFYGNEFSGNKRGPSGSGTLSNSLTRVDVSIYNDYGATFKASNNKFQLDYNTINYPVFEQASYGWVGLENINGNTFANKDNLVTDPGCTVSATNLVNSCTSVVNVITTPECNTIDTDRDGIPDNIDLDDDNDGIPDTVENAGCSPASIDCDTDGDGIPNRLDLDSDNDGINDLIESGNAAAITADTNGDGTLDKNESEPGANGIPLAAEGTEGGTVPAPKDSDGDGHPDFLDLDSDNDGINDIIESGNAAAIAADTNGDGFISTKDAGYADADKDGVPDAVDGNPAAFGDPATTSNPNTLADTDKDGVPDFRDLDSDNDGINDIIESGNPVAVAADTNGDGFISSADAEYADADKDGVADKIDGDPAAFGDPAITGNPNTPADFDFDNVPDFRDLDSDNDGINDVIEGGNGALDTNKDGVISVGDSGYNGDADGDGITNIVDGDTAGFGDGTHVGGSAGTVVDSDADGVTDFRDLDSDNDGIKDITENGMGSLDGNNDGRIDNLSDPDKDGVQDAVDGNTTAWGDPDGKGPLSNTPVDTDSDGTPNYIDLTSNGTVNDVTTTPYAGKDANGDGRIDGAVDPGTGIPLAALPVVFGEVSAVIKNQTLYVKWATLSEKNFSHFRVEVSADGKNFKQLAKVVSQAQNGESDAKIEYTLEKKLTEISLLGISGLLAIAIVLLAFAGTISNRKNSIKAIVALLFVIGLSFIQQSCRKADLGVDKITNASIYIKIVAVDIDGRESNTTIFKAVNE